MQRWIFDSLVLGDQNPRIVHLISEYFPQLQSLVNNSQQTLLHVASDGCNLQVMTALFQVYHRHQQEYPEEYNREKMGLWVNKKDGDGFTALHYAVFRHQIRLVVMLQRQGADSYITNSDGLNCLHLAAQGGSPLLMHYFLGKGLKLSSIDSHGNTALHWACYSGMQNAVSALIAWGAQMDKRQNQHGMTPLHLGVLSANGRVIKKMLINGCDRKIRNRQGKRPLDLAQQKQYTQIVKMLKDQPGPLQLLGLKPRYSLNARRGCSFYFAGAILFLSCIFNIPYYVQFQMVIYTYLAVIAAFIGILCLVLFLVLAYSDPGIIQPRQNDFAKILRNVHPNKICFQCSLIKPPQSRHCSLCGRCMAVYDHHCPWLGNCIGANNYFMFIVFLVVLVVYTCYNVVFHAINFVHVGYNFDTTKLAIVKFACSAFEFILSCLITIPLIYLLSIQFRNLAQGLTTLQRLNKRQPNIKLKTIQLSKQTQPQLLQNMTELTSRTHQISESKQRTQIRQKNIQIHANKKVGCMDMLFGNRKDQRFYYVPCN